MFDKQYRFTGTHAKKVNELTAVFDEKSKSKLFEKNIDVYMNASLIGFLFHRKGVKNTEGDVSPQNIFPEQMINYSDKLKYNLRLIVLLDKEHEPDPQIRLDRAFRSLGSQEDLDLYDEYILGGVDVLHEKLIEGYGDPMDYINRLYDFVEDFQDKFNQEVSCDEILNGRMVSID